MLKYLSAHPFTRILPLLLALTAAATGAIQAFDLHRMVERSQLCITGTIVSREGFMGSHPQLGRIPMTRLTIEGRDLHTGRTGTFTACFLGGTVGAETVRCSTQPGERETEVGGRVLAFANYEAVYGCHHLTAQKGGLFRLQHGRAGEVVIGKGWGTAVERNTLLSDLETQIGQAREEGR